MDALRHALAWAREAKGACELGVCSVSMDALIVAGVRHLMNADACEKVEVSPGVRLLLPDAARERISALHQWIGRWRAAADEAAKLGLGRNIPYDYWQKNIELPEAVTRARRWFETAANILIADQLNFAHLSKFTTDGNRYLAAIIACQSSWPRARSASIERFYLEGGVSVAQWAHMGVLVALEIARAKEYDAASIEAISQKSKKTRDDYMEARKMFRQWKKDRRAFRRGMLKKRTCSHCGKTAPLSEISFAYCGGCRHPSVARADRPRYCSEACQRAHWHAGHKDECPCAKDF